MLKSGWICPTAGTVTVEERHPRPMQSFDNGSWYCEPVFGVRTSLLSLQLWFQVLHTFFPRHPSQIVGSGTCAARWTSVVSICFARRIFDLVLKVIVSVIYRILIIIHCGYHNFCYGSCTRLYIMDVSRDKIHNNILEISRTVKKLTKQLKPRLPIYEQQVLQTSLDQSLCFWNVMMTQWHHWTLPSMVKEYKSVLRIIWGQSGEGAVGTACFGEWILLLATVRQLGCVVW
jgi:hypothetical protein